VEFEDVDAPYRAAWARIVRQLQIATALGYAVAVAATIESL